MKKSIYFIFVSVIIIFFLINSKVAFEGSSNGLVLWLNIVVPTLLPFMILSSILTKLHNEKFLAGFLSPITSRIFGLSPAGNYILFIGLFCGYPLGAKTAADLLKEKRISLAEAQYLMNFCNNISPNFSIGFICNTLINKPKLTPYILLILYGIPISIGFLTKFIYFRKKEDNSYKMQHIIIPQKINIINILDDAIINAAETTLKLGGYIILFSIFCSLIEVSHIIPTVVKTLLIIILEVTTGCRYCVSSQFLAAHQLTLPLLLACATFGGISGIAQTCGMIQNTSLSIKQYILFRILCSIIVFSISYLVF